MINDTHTRRRTAVDNQVTLLALLDLSAAFKCVDHDILLSRLQSSFGLGGITLTWIQSCLVSKLTVSKLTCQRVGLSASCLVSELTVSELACQRDLCLQSGHTYADDSKLYINVLASESHMAAAQLAACVEGLDQWMGSNRLKLNTENTQLNLDRNSTVADKLSC